MWEKTVGLIISIVRRRSGTERISAGTTWCMKLEEYIVMRSSDSPRDRNKCLQFFHLPWTMIENFSHAWPCRKRSVHRKIMLTRITVRSDDSFEESPSRLMLTNLNFFAQSNASLCRFPRPSFLFAEIYGGSQSAIPPLRQSQNRRGASGSPQP